MLIRVVSTGPLSGKTTVLCGLAQALSESGASVSLLRLSGDVNAVADAKLLASLPANARPNAEPVDLAVAREVASQESRLLLEAPAGEMPAVEDARTIIVARYSESIVQEVGRFADALGEQASGVVVTFVPERRKDVLRQALAAAGLREPILLLEDRLLAAPTLHDVAEAMAARTMFVDGRADDVLDRIYISSISADPEQEYVARLNPNLLIVRSDKPDQQLAALNGGVPRLLITGEMPVLSYVLERAEEEGIPLLLTALETPQVVERLEGLYGAVPMRGRAKLDRIGQVMKESLPAGGLAWISGVAG